MFWRDPCPHVVSGCLLRQLSFREREGWVISYKVARFESLVRGCNWLMIVCTEVDTLWINGHNWRQKYNASFGDNP